MPAETYKKKLLSFILWTGMPCESFLIEGYDHLWAASVGLTGWDQICFIRVFPKKQSQHRKTLRATTDHVLV